MMDNFFMLNVQVNNFSVMLGRSHRFLGITSTWGGGGGVNMSCSRTLHGDKVGLKPPTSESEDQGINHQATATLSRIYDNE